MSKISLTASTLCALRTTDLIMDVLLSGCSEDYPLVHADIIPDVYIGNNHRTVKLNVRFGVRSDEVSPNYTSIEASVVCRLRKRGTSWHPASVLFKKTGGIDFENTSHRFRFDHENHVLHCRKHWRRNGGYAYAQEQHALKN